MAKTTNKGFRQNFRPFFGRIGGKDYKKRFSRGDKNHFGGLLVHIYHQKKRSRAVQNALASRIRLAGRRLPTTVLCKQSLEAPGHVTKILQTENGQKVDEFETIDIFQNYQY